MSGSGKRGGFFSAVIEYFKELGEPLRFTEKDGAITVCGYRDRLAPNCEIPSEMLGMPVKAIGSRAFLQCPFIYNVWIREGVETVGSNAFSSCDRLSQIHMASIKTIERNAFFECMNLFCVDFSPCLDEIGDRAFYGCTGLRDVTLPDSVTTIGKQAFFGCKELKRIRLPLGLERIDRTAFENCTSLECIFVERDSVAAEVLSHSELYSSVLRYVSRI